MLDSIEAAHFDPLTGKICPLQLPDGSLLSVLVEGVSVKGEYRNPYAPATQRLPFSVSLTAQQATNFIEGPCTIDLPELGPLENVYVSRVAALGRDHSGAYYQIVFN